MPAGFEGGNKVKSIDPGRDSGRINGFLSLAVGRGASPRRAATRGMAWRSDAADRSGSPGTVRPARFAQGISRLQQAVVGRGVSPSRVATCGAAVWRGLPGTVRPTRFAQGMSQLLQAVVGRGASPSRVGQRLTRAGGA